MLGYGKANAVKTVLLWFPSCILCMNKRSLWRLTVTFAVCCFVGVIILRLCNKSKCVTPVSLTARDITITDRDELDSREVGKTYEYGYNTLCI